ncbi:hypothetical protein QR680_013178 [Steinernema hermaphroditum]|uniref:Uncharacterized protein n=1 Tax=Steinernema hermaphroditum TaxID=289476 RepID=A0AA39I6M9_9BILA|nr:hypothetical protein QR680_013178 [Steinernema hermaphroditum]
MRGDKDTGLPYPGRLLERQTSRRPTAAKTARLLDEIAATTPSAAPKSGGRRIFLLRPLPSASGGDPSSALTCASDYCSLWLLPRISAQQKPTRSAFVPWERRIHRDPLLAK